MQSVFDAYTVETGKKVQLLSLDDYPGLASNIDAESLPDADLFLFPSLADLWRVAEQDRFRPTFDPSIDSNIPAELRDAEARWTGLASSARLLVYNSKLVTADELTGVADYAALGAEQWLGKLCLSSSTVSGNLTLVAFLIQKYGLRDAEIVVRRWRANLASNIFYTDAALIEAISSGQCAAGIAGSNALAAHKAVSSDSSVEFHQFTDAAEVVVEVSGGGVSRHAHNPEGAAALLSWLAISAPNALYAALGDEFPANAGAAVAPGIQAWQQVVSRPTRLSTLAFLHDEAVLLVERAKYP